MAHTDTGKPPVLTVTPTADGDTATAVCSCGEAHHVDGSHDEALTWWHSDHLGD